MFTIAKQFHFSASHQLTHLMEKQPDHPCARLHGHNYAVEVILASWGLDDDGFVVDYGDLASFRDYIDSTLDHRHLNDVLGGSQQTTAENIALHLWSVARALGFPIVAVRVSETPKTWAEYRTFDRSVPPRRTPKDLAPTPKDPEAALGEDRT